MSWSDPDSTPVDDLEQWCRSAYQASDRPRAIWMTSANKIHYEAVLARTKRIEGELSELPSRAHIRRYKLKRQLGLTRTRILLPRVYRIIRGVRMRLWEYKHRDDIDWY